MRTVMIVAGMIMLLCCTLPAQTMWTMYGADRAHTFHAINETVLKPPLQITGSIPVHPEEMSSDGEIIVYAMDSDSVVIEARDFDSGDSLWSFGIPGSGGSPGMTPTISGSTVLCGGQNGPGLYALDRLTGVQKWFKPIVSLFGRHPVIDGGYAYIAADSLYCIDLRTGHSRWSTRPSGQFSPAVDDQNVYVAHSTVKAYDKATGALRWEGEDCSSTRFSLGANYLYFINQDSVIACSKKNGSRSWAQAIPGANGTAFAINGTALTNDYFCFTAYKNNNEKGEVFVLNARTGAPVWQYEFSGTGVYQPVIANGVVYTVQVSSGDLFGFDLSSGAILMQHTSLTWYYQPIVVSNRLFVITASTIKVLANEEVAVSLPPNAAPEAFVLQQNFPNPFNAVTTIAYQVAEPCHVSLCIYNLRGERVEALVDERQEPGAYRALFTASRLPSGIYFYQISMKNYRASKKLTLLR